MKRLLLTVITVVLSAGMGYAAQSNAKVTIPVNKTSATSGKQMYTNYCAPCHGVDGKGHGTVATALKKQPTDLTMLSRNNHGEFPDAHVVTVLQNGVDLPSHGSAEMPVWGPILGRMNTMSTQERMLRISNLSRYLQTIQSK